MVSVSSPAWPRQRRDAATAVPRRSRRRSPVPPFGGALSAAAPPPSPESNTSSTKLKGSAHRGAKGFTCQPQTGSAMRRRLRQHTAKRRSAACGGCAARERAPMVWSRGGRLYAMVCCDGSGCESRRKGSEASKSSSSVRASGRTRATFSARRLRASAAASGRRTPEPGSSRLPGKTSKQGATHCARGSSSAAAQARRARRRKPARAGRGSARQDVVRPRSDRQRAA